MPFCEQKNHFILHDKPRSMLFQFVLLFLGPKSSTKRGLTVQIKIDLLHYTANAACTKTCFLHAVIKDSGRSLISCYDIITTATLLHELGIRRVRIRIEEFRAIHIAKRCAGIIRVQT